MRNVSDAVNLRPSDASCKHLGTWQQIEPMAHLPYVGANPAGIQGLACARGPQPGPERGGHRTVVGGRKGGAIAGVALVQGSDGPLDVARHSEVSHGHFA
jgi:hypothetical protein